MGWGFLAEARSNPPITRTLKPAKEKGKGSVSCQILLGGAKAISPIRQIFFVVFHHRLSHQFLSLQEFPSGKDGSFFSPSAFSFSKVVGGATWIEVPWGTTGSAGSDALAVTSAGADSAGIGGVSTAVSVKSVSFSSESADG